jgi:hypothetical protein
VVGRGTPWWGSIDVVPVCKVANAILKAANVDDCSGSGKDDTSLNWSSTAISDAIGRTKIRYVTNGLSFSAPALNKACGKWFVSAYPKPILRAIQQVECALLSLIFFSWQAGAKLQLFYHLYDYFASHTFDFPTIVGLNVPAMLLDELSDETVTETSLHMTSWVKRHFKNEHAKKKNDQTLNSVVMRHTLILLPLFGSFLYTLFMKQKVSTSTFSIKLTVLDSVFQSFITPYLVQLVPYSGFLYVGVLVFAAVVRQTILFMTNKKASNHLPREQPIIIVGPTLQKMHNLNMSFQSFLLITLTLHACQWLSFNPYTILLDDARYAYPNLHLLLGAFLLSKLCEWVDTVILILNGKPLLLLHLWHHGTIVWGFYHGFWSSAQSWIAFWNSLIHVVMYLYYARLT